MSFDSLLNLTRASLVITIAGLASIAAAQPDEATVPKRSVVNGLPVLADAGAVSNEHSDETGEGRKGEPEESGIQYGLSDTAKVVRNGVELAIGFDSARRVFAGTLRNAAGVTVRQVRVEVHLSNGVELGPTPNVDLKPGQSAPVELRAGSQEFNQFSTHVEIGSGEHEGREDDEHRGRRGGEHGDREGGEHRGREGGRG